MSYSIIPSSALVDNVTIDKNPADEIRSIGYTKKYNNTSNTALITSNPSFSTNSTSYVLGCTITTNKDLNNVKIGGIITSQNGSGSSNGVDIRKNGVSLFSEEGFFTPSGTLKTTITNFLSTDTIEIYIKSGTSTTYTSSITQAGVYGSLSETIVDEIEASNYTIS